MTQKQESQPTPLQVTGVISFYMVAALVMVFVNKAVLNKTPELPTLLLLIQQLITVLLLHVAAFLPSTPLRHLALFSITVPPLDIDIAKKLLPYVTVGMTGLIFNTLCLAGVDASFFQIARGLLLPSTIVLSAFTTRTRPKFLVLLAAFIISTGYFLGLSPSSYSVTAVSFETRLRPLIYGSLSSLLLALHAVLMKSAHHHVGAENSVVKLMYYSNLMSAMILLPFTILNGEFSALFIHLQGGGVAWKTFASGCVVTGVFGFLLGVANLLSVKVTSPVTHMVSSAAKSVLQTVLGVYIFGEVITIERGTSIFIITIGALFYSWVQTKCSPQPKDGGVEILRASNHDIEKGKG